MLLAFWELRFRLMSWSLLRGVLLRRLRLRWLRLGRGIILRLAGLSLTMFIYFSYDFVDRAGP